MAGAMSTNHSLKQEPTAEMRVAAKAVKEMHEALIEAGFTDTQALTILSTWLIAASPK